MSSEGTFKPTRPRSSLAAPTTTVPNKENTTTNNNSKKKRAQSLGGEQLQSLPISKKAKQLAELSPSKQLRRGLVPRRSILKVKPTQLESHTTNFTSSTSIAQLLARDSAHTTDLSNLSSAPFGNRRASSAAGPQPQRHDDSSDEEESGEFTRDLETMENERMNRDAAEDRRKSLARRVSFAPNAHIRTFTPDKPTAQAQALLQQQRQQQDQLSSPTSSASGGGDSMLVDQDDDDEEAEEEQEEQSMEMASNDETRAFAGHYKGTLLPVGLYEEEEEDDDEESDEDASGELEDDGQSMEMEVAGEGVTRAFAVFASSVGGSAKPRPSEVLRQEDAEDEELLRIQRGAGKATLPSSTKGKAKVMFGGVADSDEGESFLEYSIEEEGVTVDDQTMDVTMALGGVIEVSEAGKRKSIAPVSQEQDDEEEEEDDDNEEQDGQTMDLDQTAEMTRDMQDATSYGGIVSSQPYVPASSYTSANLALVGVGIPTPSTPSARLQAQLFARQSLTGGPTPAAAPASPYRASPRRALLPPSSIVQPFVAPSSPRRVPTSPRKSGIVAPLTPLANSTPTAQRRMSASPNKSRSKTTTTPNRPHFAFGTRSPFVPGGASSARKSPGPSNMRGMLQDQLHRNHQGLASPAGAAATKRVVELMGEQNKSAEEELTGSSFDGYEGDLASQTKAIRSVDDFFDATGTGFVKDLLAITGVSLGSTRRQSVAPRNTSRQATEAPTFVDLAVAGGSKTLFYQLYQSDQSRLHDGIETAMRHLSEINEQLQVMQPTIFAEWSNASESHRAAMQNQLGMIKAHYYHLGRIQWNEWRSTNYESIIAVMEDNLEGLRTDNAVVEEAKFSEVLPELEQRRATLLAELLQERERDLELSACDQSELDEFHAAIVEQGEQLQIHERQYEGHLQNLNVLTVKAEELALKEAQMTLETDELQRKLEEGRCFTKAEVLRLRVEYEALQHLHGWSLVHFSSDAVTLSHLDQFDVTLSLAKGFVRGAQFELRPRNAWARDVNPGWTLLKNQITSYLFEKLISNVGWVLADSSIDQQNLLPRSILTRISSFWTTSRYLLHEIYLVSLRFPCVANISTPSSSKQEATLSFSAEIHIPSATASFFVIFEFTGEELVIGEERRPVAVNSVAQGMVCDVVPKFGNVDLVKLRIVGSETLDNGGRGALLHACTQAELEATRS